MIPERERVLRWLAESPTIFAEVRRLLQEYDQAMAVAGAAQAEQARLQQQYAALHGEFGQCLTDLKRQEKARTETAEWFIAMALEVAARFPLPHA